MTAAAPLAPARRAPAVRRGHRALRRAGAETAAAPSRCVTNTIDALVHGWVGGGIGRGARRGATAVLAAIALLGAVAAPACQVAPADADTAHGAAGPDPAPATALASARAVMGFARAGQSVIHYRAQTATEQNYQSDRSYPPFFSAMTVKEAWFDPTTGVERAGRTPTCCPIRATPRP